MYCEVFGLEVSERMFQIHIREIERRCCFGE